MLHTVGRQWIARVAQKTSTRV